MPFLYSSISPQYLEYIASNYTRAQIEADPSICHLLEDPYIKDNMEIAILANEAKNGDFAEKKEFIQYFLCNGPELDVQTILYYRKEINQNAEYAEIARNYFSDITLVRNLRTSVYNKSTSDKDGNCFTDPCNYLGPFSDVVGIIGDSRVVKSNRNTMASFVKWMLNEEDEDKKPEMVSQGSMRPNTEKLLPPTVRDDYRCFNAHSLLMQTEFYQSMPKNNAKHALLGGDSNAIKDAQTIEDTISLKTYSTLGDCARLFAHAKGYSGSDSRMNKQLALSAPSGYKWPHGVRQTIPNPVVESDAAPPANLPDMSKMVNSGKFIDSDGDMIFKWDVSGAVLVSDTVGEEIIDTVYVHDKNDPDNNRQAGSPSATRPKSIPDGKTVYTCPYRQSDFSGNGVLDTFADNFMVGCYVNYEVVREFFHHYFTTVTDEMLGKLYGGGHIMAKVRLGICESGTTMNAVVLKLPVLGSIPSQNMDGAALIHIDPAIIAAKLINGNSVVLTDTEGNEFGSGSKHNFTGTISKLGDGTIDVGNYGKSLLRNVKDSGATVTCGQKYVFKNGTNINDARVRFYLNQNDSLADIFGGAAQPASLYDAGVTSQQYINVSTTDVAISGGADEVIAQLISAYETGRTDAYDDYNWIKKEGFINYGFMNTNRDRLWTLLANYYLPNASDQYADVIRQHVGKSSSDNIFKQWAHSLQKSEYSSLYDALKMAGKTQTMKDAQLKFFWDTYGKSGKSAAAKRHLDLPLALFYCVYACNNGSQDNTFRNVEKVQAVKSAKEQYDAALKSGTDAALTESYRLAYQKKWCDAFPEARMQTWQYLHDNPASGKDYSSVIGGWRNNYKSWKTSLSGKYYLDGVIDIPYKGVKIVGTKNSTPGQPTA